MDKNYEVVISARRKLNPFSLKELAQFKDLILLFVKRDFITIYKQTILGPTWIVLQPILTTFVFTVVFSKIAGIETGVPAPLFYLSGIILWTFFSDNLIKISETFTTNQNIFSKVYFPRMVVPASLVLTNFIKLGIQLLLFGLVYAYFFFFQTDIQLEPNLLILTFPFLILIVVLSSMGVGLLICGLTTKYRDLKFLVTFGVQLLMYGSPIVYPLKLVPEKFQFLLALNPMTGVIETYKCAVFGHETALFNLEYLLLGFGISVLLFIFGLTVFKKFEGSFIDTI